MSQVAETENNLVSLLSMILGGVVGRNVLSLDRNQFSNCISITGTSFISLCNFV